MLIFKYIKARQFFPKYAPTVRNYPNKLAGHDSRHAVTFTEADKKAIKEGIKQMMKEAKTW